MGHLSINLLRYGGPRATSGGEQSSAQELTPNESSEYSS
jgi:hypothetical protein